MIKTPRFYASCTIRCEKHYVFRFSVHQTWNSVNTIL